MMSVDLRLPSPMVELHDEKLDEPGIRLYVKRDDLIHAEFPGNKWRKLKYNLREAKNQKQTQLLTFGGAYSNHIRAVAAAGHYFGFDTVGVIRGEEHSPLNPSLTYAQKRGMRLIYMDRTSYRMKRSEAVIENLRAQVGEFYLIPEGGSNALAVLGAAELVAEIDEPFDVICCPCGTGGTLAGISGALEQYQRATEFLDFV